MGVAGLRQDVEFLAAVDPVAVMDITELLEDVERPVDGRRRRLRIALPAAVDDLAAGHVAARLGEDLEDQTPLRRPAQSTRPQLVAEVG